MNLLVWSTYVEQPIGGQERISLELALQLHRRGHRVVLAGAFDHAPELRALIPPGVPCLITIGTCSASDSGHTWQPLRLASRLIREHRIQAVSAHGSVLALHEVCRRNSIPMFWTLHGAKPRPKDFLSQLKTVALRRMLKDQFCHIVGVSQRNDRWRRRTRFPGTGTATLACCAYRQHR